MHGRSDYSRVEQLRAEQDADGTHDEHVRQRFFRLYKAHPQNAMYIYLWARCVNDAAEQLKLAQEGIQADPHFSWNYNMASRALARQNRVPEAYDEANKGAAIDPGNMELSQKQTSLKAILDHKLAEEAPPAPTSEKNAARYQGLFRAPIKSPDRSESPGHRDEPPPGRQESRSRCRHLGRGSPWFRRLREPLRRQRASAPTSRATRGSRGPGRNRASTSRQSRSTSSSRSPAPSSPTERGRTSCSPTP